MKNLKQDIAGLASIAVGGAALLEKVNPWVCAIVIGGGLLLIDPTDVLALITKVAPFLSKYLPGGGTPPPQS